MKQQREHWSSRLGFVMAAAGSAIGLGSLWRFPYVAGENGGGAFVLLYLFFTFFIGLPVFIGELVMGRYTQRSSVNAFTQLSPKAPHWNLVGWLNIFTAFIILSYYSVVSGWCVNYALMSLNHFTRGRTVEQIQNLFDVMYVSADINIFWLFVFILINIGVVMGGVRKGIEYWTKILTPALLIILLGLFIYSTTLDGFGQAFKFIFYPDLAKLSPSGVLDALGMALFTLSVGIGIILTYGSYMKPTEDIPKTGLIVSSMNVLVSLIAALMIFPIIFTFNFPPSAGPGLVFKTLPVLFEKLPATLVISTTFFCLLVFTALTSSISILEQLVANLMEILNWSRKKAVLISAGAAFFFGIPTALSGSGKLFPNWKLLYGRDFFDTMSYISGSWMLPIAAMLTTVFIGWFMDKKIAKNEFMKGTTLGRFLRTWLFLIKWIAPIAIIFVILQEGGLININDFLKPMATPVN